MFVMLVGGNASAGQNEIEEKDWLGTYVGSQIPGYEIEKLKVGLFPHIAAVVTSSNTSDNSFLVVPHETADIWKKDCVSIVNFRVTFSHIELRESREGYNVTKGPGVVRMYYGDCVTKVRKLSTASKDTVAAESLSTQ